ncbi:hydrolase [Lagierella sp.]|uniref:hydrolase n=1 Tax=Lagierella sp. TaxID=2849657 RepID=UPI002625276C|nr:hydrolase [Lagierella sp.]
MNSEKIRDQKNDHLLTPKNSAFIAIDYQPIQVQSIKSMDNDELVKNIVKTSRLAKLYKLPVVLSTVNVSNGKNEPMINEIMDIFPDEKPVDRTTINSWEDEEFKKAVEDTGRKKLIMTALWTEACLSFPALDAIEEGYEVYAVVDAVGGTSKTAHETALRRMEQAGVKLISWVQLACELQRDWNREETAEEFADILFK